MVLEKMYELVMNGIIISCQFHFIPDLPNVLCLCHHSLLTPPFDLQSVFKSAAAVIVLYIINAVSDWCVNDSGVMIG